MSRLAQVDSKTSVFLLSIKCKIFHRNTNVSFSFFGAERELMKSTSLVAGSRSSYSFILAPTLLLNWYYAFEVAIFKKCR